MQSSFSTSVEASLETLWYLLLDKIENPERYIPGVEESKVLEKDSSGILRQMRTVRNGQPIELLEKITIDEQAKEIHFTLVDNPLFTGQMINKVELPIKEGEPLMLTFSVDHRPRNHALKADSNNSGDAAQIQLIEQAVLHVKSMAEQQEKQQHKDFMSPKFPGANASIVKNLIVLFETLNVKEALTYFSEDAVYRFGNAPAAKGRQAIWESINSTHLEQIKGIAFDIKTIWENADYVICELEIHYTRNDNTILTLPCTDIFRLRGEMVQEMRVYMDPSPLFAIPEKTNPQNSLTDIVKRAFSAVESNNVDQYISFFTQNAVYKVGNIPPVIGPQGIREFALPLLQMFKNVTHDIISVWERKDTVACEVNVIYNRNDGKVFQLPCLSVIRFEGDKILEYQAYIDPSPAFS